MPIIIENIPNTKWTLINSEAYCRWYGKDSKVEILNSDKIWKIKLTEVPTNRDRNNWRERVGNSIGEEYVPAESKGTSKTTSMCISEVANHPKSRVRNFIWTPEVSQYPIYRSAYPIDTQVNKLRLIAHLVPTLQQRLEMMEEETEQSKPYESQPNELGNQFVSNVNMLVADLQRFLNPETIIDREARVQDQEWRDNFEKRNFRLKVIQIKSAVEILGKKKLDLSQYDGQEKGSFLKMLNSASEGSFEAALTMCNVILENMPFDPTFYTKRNLAPWIK